MAADIGAQLTLSDKCDGCLQKSLSIADVEGRISELYWIRDEEKRLDSVITLGAVPPVSSAELGLTIPAMDAVLPAAATAALTPGS